MRSLEWELKYHGRSENLIHYMNDFFCAGPSRSAVRQQAVDSFIFFVEFLGVPLPQKKQRPDTTSTFLGVQLNSVSQTISMPLGMMQELFDEFTVFSSLKKSTKRDILSFVGVLSFATKCIPARQIILRKMLNLAHLVKHLHYAVNLNSRFHADPNWWKHFLYMWNGI